LRKKFCEFPPRYYTCPKYRRPFFFNKKIVPAKRKERETLGQFHQHFTSSFYARRSLKRKNAIKPTVFFGLLGSVRVKTFCKMLVKLTHEFCSIWCARKVVIWSIATSICTCILYALEQMTSSQTLSEWENARDSMSQKIRFNLS